MKFTLLQEHVCYMLLEQCAFQIWSWSISNLEFRILFKIINGSWSISNLEYFSKLLMARTIWSWSIFNFEYFSKLIMVQDQISRGQNLKKPRFTTSPPQGECDIQIGKSILQVPDTGTRVLDNTTPFFAFQYCKLLNNTNTF